ncbi:hypothetical protein RV11_GL000999 [Enterococcus phoeniculicola]|jgi:membrane protease YdiL (CAAX protease family)|uniref:CAAX prenyl protease 2/Lysostaphin resistance protein A-like domain-containing protein n=1 Tax=Enterococcus phoeniculicola ATCC BAA-412 TaxID=1158610 RepID=R3WHR4_9ENTE|nr:hypothetical protein UC3_03428 [Enterococcus phoeniculicola ATCC BAA-412]EOT78643.1 hypothetical protein I589_00148 [Enterococcus phoeniculicola ATCC BAA-412]OJG70599.1 hypothetical protein RV11_GL000999 [Enterococcus phoeniculicola]
MSINSKKAIFLSGWIFIYSLLYSSTVFFRFDSDVIKLLFVIFGFFLFRKDIFKQTKNTNHIRLGFISVISAIIIFIVVYLFYKSLYNDVRFQNPVFSNNLIEVAKYLILAPLFEELVYRYSLIVISANHKMLNGASIIISSILFSYAHRFVVNGQIMLLLQFTILGLGLGILYLKEKNLLLPMYIHFFYNLLIILISNFK